QGQEQDLGRREASLIPVSSGGPWGDWAWLDMCPKGSYTSGISFKLQPPWHPGGFVLQVQAPLQRLLNHGLAVTNTQFVCSDGLEGLGSAWGQWGSPPCPMVVCSIQAWQETALGLKRDDTALNDLHLFCCP
ncbi:PREDICTED: vitelline membrane outer layer protein 1 homolog, partial [Acanthisitta chloris]|uniref:vitelline membrane outer layer protein 1 homolog n=1 Tax=Acanthisitta chloris TaxID=57068 RepID=UPI0004F0E543